MINAPPGCSKHELDGEGVDFKDLENLNSEDKEKAKESADNSEAKDGVLNNAENSEETSNSIKDNNESTQKETERPETETETEDKKKVEEVESTDQEIPLKETAKETNENDEKDADDYVPEIKKSKPIEKEENTDETIKNEVDGSNKVDVEKDIPVATTTANMPKIKLSNDTNNKIEILDPDDYLLYLEVILTNIHKRFYSIYDETKDIPDLKIIVPKIRSEVLRDCNLVFSGLVPTNMKLQQSRAYFIAKSLGAEVSQNILENTTHLVAVTAGTFKVNAAKKNPKIKIVSANWLWSCAERWEHVEERLFPLDRKIKSNKRQPPAHCHSPEHVINYSEKSEISSSSMAQQNAAESSKFIDTINPLLSFSNADLAGTTKCC
ncbi:hypothetical protein DOY81_013136 [Sarcophaga bullata]|nr:hypothetical protein DOY81_013136 [Sarcophaga bullata]